MKTNIIITLQVEGLHCWPDCTIKEVDFLRNQHRHLFYITCKKEVNHSDREIEIIQFKHRVFDYLASRYWNKTCFQFKNMSCEQIAQELLRAFNLCYCSVLEDNENGAEVTV